MAVPKTRPNRSAPAPQHQRRFAPGRRLRGDIRSAAAAGLRHRRSLGRTSGLLDVPFERPKWATKTRGKTEGPQTWRVSVLPGPPF